MQGRTKTDSHIVLKTMPKKKRKLNIEGFHNSTSTILICRTIYNYKVTETTNSGDPKEKIRKKEKYKIKNYPQVQLLRPN